MENRILENAEKWDTYKNNNITIEIMIAIAIAFSPYNMLRVAGIGITEVILLLLTAYCLVVRKDFKVTKKDNQISIMYFFILFGSILGYTYNFLFLGNIGEQNSAVFNFVAYAICMMCCYGIEVLLKNDIINPELLLNRIFYLFNIIVTILFVLSRITDSFAGFPLMYYTWFCPLSDNIHQLAMVMSMFPFLGVCLAFKKKRFAVKILYLILSIIDVIIAFNTGSSKVLLGFIVGGIAVLLLTVIKGAVKMRILMIMGIILAIFLVFVSNIDIFVSLFRDYDVHGGRETLYANGLQMIINSPIFGYGPSIVVTNTYGILMDVHQTILASYLAGGAIAFIALINTILKKFKIIVNDKWLFASMCGFLIYFLGGDILRKECMWIMLIISTKAILQRNYTK